MTNTENNTIVNEMAIAALTSQKAKEVLYEKVKRIAFSAYRKLHVDENGGDEECFDGLAYIALIDALEKWKPLKGAFAYYYHSRAFYLAQCHIRSDNFAIALPTSYRVKKHGKIAGTMADLGGNDCKYELEQDDYTGSTKNNVVIDPQTMSPEHLQFYNELYVNGMKRKDYIQKYSITYQAYTKLKAKFEDYIKETYRSNFE